MKIFAAALICAAFSTQAAFADDCNAFEGNDAVSNEVIANVGGPNALLQNPDLRVYASFVWVSEQTLAVSPSSYKSGNEYAAPI